MRTFKYIITTGLLLLCITTAQAAELQTITTAQMERFVSVIATIHHYYVEPVNNQQLFDDAIAGMLEKLDPHSAYLDEEDVRDIQVIANGKFDGIGVTVIPEFGILKVIAPIEGSPADKAGVKTGDLIVKIDNKLIKDMPSQKVINLIRGKKGTKVTLYIVRKQQDKLLKITVKRASIKVPTVTEKVLDHNYGYIRIAIFYKNTAKDVAKAIQQLKQQTHNKLNGVIIDLRNNPGGLFEPSVDVADDFLDAKKLKHNKLIVYIQGAEKNDRENFKAHKGDLLAKKPIVVLINSGSASAAEIVAGALQDHKRAVIVGTQSFGKGSVQTVIPIDKKTAIKLTTALYYTPNGRSIQAKGIKPNVEVKPQQITLSKDSDTPLAGIYEADLLNHIKNGDMSLPNKQEIMSDKQLMQDDFQLYMALRIVTGLGAT
ncbi:MAG: S41 family peptidase [Gammaproteobacteria bacterium]|nr:S41 family peptidase [Gammaproteobacteria bacterium]